MRLVFIDLETGGLPEDFKLGTVCRHLGVELTDAHDALADCRATVALCRALNVARQEA